MSRPHVFALVSPLALSITLSVTAAGCDPCNSFRQTCDVGPVNVSGCLSGQVLVPNGPDVPRIATVLVGAYTQEDSGEYVVAADHQATARVGSDFHWEICELPPGPYYVFGVGDDNRDGIYELTTESFGGWPAGDEPAPIELEPSTAPTGLDFALSGGIFDADG